MPGHSEPPQIDLREAVRTLRELRGMVDLLERDLGACAQIDPAETAP